MYALCHVRRYIFYHTTLIFVRFLLFLVMVSQFSQYLSFNFPIFACLTLPRLLGNSDTTTHDDIVPLPRNENSVYEVSVV